MTLYKNKYRIESARLNKWDYSSNGCYFITICTIGRQYFLGTINGEEMVLSDIGKVAEKYWCEIPDHFPIARLDKWVIMPNHIHGIIGIRKASCGDKAVPCLYENNKNPISRFQNQGKGTISAIIGSFKSICTKTINKSQNKIRFAWQPRFYDHVIRDENELNRIRKYIVKNPLNWNIDDLYSL
jgi:REP element-mobilizing transposase RayT